MASIRKRGDKYQVQVRRKGQAAHVRSFQHKSDAVIWARDMESKADRHDLPPNLKVLEGCTLGDLVERYRASVTPRKRTRDVETIVLTAFLRQPICRMSLSRLGRSHFAQYRDQRLMRVKPATFKRELNVLHNVFEIARREWNVPIRENPVDTLAFKTPDQRRERRLKEGEYARLIEAARSRQNPYIIPIIEFAIETGMRRGEILSMRWDHVDVERRSVLIPTTKNGHARTIPLSRLAVTILADLPRTGDRVFPVSGNAVRLAWGRAVKKAGIDDLHFHDLRHEAISRFFELGLTAPEVALISGHRDLRMLNRYTHPTRERIAAKLDRPNGETAP